jgi:hypothetical protein
MTEIYQPLDTHINGIVSSKLRQFWSDEMFDKPNQEVTIASTIKAITRFLQELSSTFIRRAFKEALFDVAKQPRQAPIPPPNLITSIASTQEALQKIDEIMNDFQTVLQ